MSDNILRFPHRLPPYMQTTETWHLNPSGDAGVRVLQDIGWELGDDGAWHPPGYQGPAMPFVLAMQNKMEQLTAKAAEAAFIEGHAKGVQTMLPWAGAALIVGFLFGLVVI